MQRILIPRYKRNSQAVTAAIAAEIKALLKTKAMKQHDIAARYGINQGRVSEINTGLKYADIEPAQLEFNFE